MEDQESKKSTFNPFKTKRYVAIAKEPVFVGTGGYRIGRVDNTIVRDPATNLPKIPGSTISGNARYYSWLSLKSQGMDLNLGCAKGKKTEKEQPCGVCPVCLSYGYINEESAHSGLAYFSDARILFFPVATMSGTVWITSDEIAKEFFDPENLISPLNKEEFIASKQLEKSLPSLKDNEKVLNFGWLMLRERKFENLSTFEFKKDSKNIEISTLKKSLSEILERSCIVSKEVFSQIVNSNLETRTSVSINPVTGAAESGALFTYEALPRGTVFVMDITYENPINYKLKEPIELVIKTVEDGLRLFSSLGIGGMGTRGFGKLQIQFGSFYVNESDYWSKIKNYLEELKSDIENLEKQKEAMKNSNSGKEQDKNTDNNIEKEIKSLCQSLNLWKEYINTIDDNIMKGIKESDKIVKDLSEIKEEIKETCEEENSKNDQEDENGN